MADAAFMGMVDFLAGLEPTGLDVHAHLLVSIAEGHALGCQAVHLFDAEHQVVAGVREDVLVHLHAADDVGGHRQAVAQLLEGGQEDLLQNLQVAEIAAGQVVHYQGYLLGQGLQFVALGTCQFEDVGVLLMGHDAGARGALLRQADKAEVLAIEEAGIEGQLRQCAGNTGQCKTDVPLRLSASHLGIHHVVVHRVKAQQVGGHLAIQRKTAAVAGCRTQGVAVGDAVGGLQHDEVVDQTFGVRPEPQAETRGHGHLQVGVAGHEHMLVALALLLQFVEEAPDILGHEAQLLARPQFQVDEHLVVAAASAVNLLAHVAQTACEQEFDLRMHILDALLYLETAFLGIAVDAAQFGQQGVQLVAGEQSDALQHGDVGHRAQHVMASQIEVELTVSANGETGNFFVNVVALVPKFFHRFLYFYKPRMSQECLGWPRIA